MTSLKLKFKMQDNKIKTISIKNANPAAQKEDITALANHMVTNSMLNLNGVKLASFEEAVIVETNETKVK